MCWYKRLEPSFLHRVRIIINFVSIHLGRVTTTRKIFKVTNLDKLFFSWKCIMSFANNLSTVIQNHY